MVASVMWLVLALQAFAACGSSEESLAASGNTQAVLTSSGAVLKAEVAQRKGIIRRHDHQDGSFAELAEGLNFYGVRDRHDRASKIERGLASPNHPQLLKTTAQSYSAPPWEAHADMPKMPGCAKDVTQDMGISDYGNIPHSCVACQQDCTERNMQQATNMTWLFEPALDKCNAFNLTLYSNWSNIEHLDCEKCAGKGIRHKFEMSFATNAGDGLNNYKHKDLTFEGWMGPEVSGGEREEGSDFLGKHVFEVTDTVEPSLSENCEVANPPGRWLALPGSLKRSETFHCKRVCLHPSGCKCGRTTGMRCVASIAMSSNQVFAYNIHRIHKTTAGSLDGKSHTGPEWEVTAEDMSQPSPVLVVGRVILAGNSDVYGIQSMRQSHQHIGCVPCDLFYESTIVSGPFIHEPAGIHVLRSANGDPPHLTSESCELFRMSSIGGFAVQFETGPGLWPSVEANNTIFTCNHNSTTNAQCPT